MSAHCSLWDRGMYEDMVVAWQGSELALNPLARDDSVR